jgi:hypothetical protein
LLQEVDSNRRPAEIRSDPAPISYDKPGFTRKVQFIEAAVPADFLNRPRLIKRVFGMLLNEERTTEQDLQGLREDKLSQYTSRSCAETTVPA